MIHRTKPPEQPKDAQPETPEGPSILVELTDLDFNFGLNDTCSLTLGPEDRLNATSDTFVIEMAGERVEIDRSRVRWWTQRKRQVAVGPQPFDPAAQGAA